MELTTERDRQTARYYRTIQTYTKPEEQVSHVKTLLKHSPYSFTAKTFPAVSMEKQPIYTDLLESLTYQYSVITGM